MQLSTNNKTYEPGDCVLLGIEDNFSAGSFGTGWQLGYVSSWHKITNMFIDNCHQSGLRIGPYVYRSKIEAYIKPSVEIQWQGGDYPVAKQAAWFIR